MMNLYEKELLRLLDDTTIMNPLTLTPTSSSTPLTTADDTDDNMMYNATTRHTLDPP